MDFLNKILRRSASQASETPAEPVPLSHSYEASILPEVVYAKTKALTPAIVPNMTGAERTMLITLLASRLASSSPLRVLDFGGACGFHYMAASLLKLPLQWAVVETAAMAERAKDLESGELRFFSDIDSARQWLGHIDLVHSSSALQYVPNPAKTLSDLISLDARIMAWSRMALTAGPQTRETQTSQLAHNGPGPLPAQFTDGIVEYTLTKFPKIAFLAAHQFAYRLDLEFDEPSQGFIFLHR
jgi:putative methyltransferase (TIGR04325 family)